MNNQIRKGVGKSGLIFPFALLIMFGCSKSTEQVKTCGDLATWSSLVYQASGYRTTSVDGTMRSFFFEDTSTPEDICPKEHINCTWFVTCKKPAFSSMTVEGVVYWMGIWEEEKYLTFDSYTNVYSGVAEAGLSQAFGDKPGWVGMKLIVRFPTQGGLDQDLATLQEYIGTVRMVIGYYLYKE